MRNQIMARQQTERDYDYLKFTQKIGNATLYLDILILFALWWFGLDLVLYIYLALTIVSTASWMIYSMKLRKRLGL